MLEDDAEAGADGVVVERVEPEREQRAAPVDRLGHRRRLAQLDAAQDADNAHEVLGDFQVTVPELGTITATQRPFTLLTSNATRELSEALKRRCLFLHLDFPDAELERRIVAARVPQLGEALAEELVRVVGVLRGLELRKAPSVSETIDWARTLVALGLDTLDDDAVRASLGVVLKHRADLVKASSELRLN